MLFQNLYLVGKIPMQSKDKRQFKNKAMKFNIQDYAEGNRACVC